MPEEFAHGRRGNHPAPPGWGAPIYGKLSSDLASAMMSINAVKGVEIGAGFDAASLTGIENADQMRAGQSKPYFLSNQAVFLVTALLSIPTLIALAHIPANQIDPMPRTIPAIVTTS